MMMNTLFRRSSSSIASTVTKRTLAALTSVEAHYPKVIARNGVSGNEICTCFSCSGRLSSYGVRNFHVNTGPLGFRASVVSQAEYAAVRDISYEDVPKGSSDDGLEIAKLGIASEIVSALAKKGITKLFPIQKAVLEPAMQGRDMIGRAKTGTGKTLAFGIPIMDKISQYNAKHGRGRHPMALVMAPTRELARQVEKEFYESAPNLDTICVYGGTPISRQMSQLDYGVDIVVGTPGRIIDLLKRGALVLSEVQFVVLDEADQMLAVGFEEDVEVILEKLPQKRQSMMFSATMPTWIKKLSQKYLKDPLIIDLVGDSDQKLAEGITLYSILSETYGKASILGPLITEHAKGGKCIIFTATKRDADRLAFAMGKTLRCEALHGDISQNERERTLAGFREGSFNVLCATDVASRGLDIPNVDLVIHYDIPNNPEIFVHRSGRTGRAGKKGTAIVIYSAQQTREVLNYEKQTGCRFKELPKIIVEGGGRDMMADMGSSSRFGSYGNKGGGRFGDSSSSRSGGFGNSGFGRSSSGGGYSGSGFGRSSSGGSYSGSGFGRSSSGGGYSGSSSGRMGGSGESDSGRFGSFGGGFGSGRSGGDFGGSSPRRSGNSDSGFSSSDRSSGFGGFGDGKSTGRRSF